MGGWGRAGEGASDWTSEPTLAKRFEDSLALDTSEDKSREEMKEGNWRRDDEKGAR